MLEFEDELVLDVLLEPESDELGELDEEAAGVLLLDAERESVR
ncbi:hypothetical protein N803_04680 [Knoellia subterranea KCTC 19937]|uniref:Uncharacterized protein n=1 Tax=Knoellia subterranea KCTC 19937 TaxID=1385521 RepID=A0A0A0JKH9_9MICO|nr:hypothetical protein N803_04680 [Knoellia subterranea KCTC 19937]